MEELIKHLQECSKHETCEKTHAAWVEVCPYEKTCAGVNALLSKAASALELKIVFNGGSK